MVDVGRKLSHYTILEKLGEGGMGTIYRARDDRLDRQVAIKLLQPDAVTDPQWRARFVKEARAASALNHPHIVTVHEVDSAPGAAGPIDFLVMELLTGGSLADSIGSGLPVAAAVDSAVQIADALTAAHRAGIIHRDLKPANVMRTADGRLKVVDFGLARLVPPDADGMTTASAVTLEGDLLGTPAYMSPEQVEGKPADARSDVFAFGLLVYELLTGRRPFRRDSVTATLAAILQDAPPPLRSVRPEVPRELAGIVERCLDRDPARRYANASEMLPALVECQRRLAGAPSVVSLLRQKRVLLPVGALLAIALTAAGVVWRQQSRVRWARDVAVPELERLVADEQYIAAFRLARDVEAIIPADPRLDDLRARFSLTRRVESDPPGAEVRYREYAAGAEAPWELAGTTPIDRVVLPFAHLRFRVTKDGYDPVDGTYTEIMGDTIRFTLDAARPAGTVRVPGGRFRIGRHTISDEQSAPFWIDRHEVTNRQFKAFVDAGGYRRPEFWKHDFVDGNRTLAWPDAMARFLDSTGRPGPATWELGSYLDGQADLPVGGVSWYEAVAYAAYAGRSLPTVFHWYRAAGLAAGMGFFPDAVLVSNFGTKAPVAVGSRPGMSPYGAMDMAGNVKEWCLNAARDGRRFILGGAWNEPSYMFRDADAHPPILREATFGFRMVTYASPVDPQLTDPLDRLERDPEAEKTVDDEAFAALRTVFEYDPGDLAARLDALDDASPHFRKELVTINAAYGGERLPLWLFLPKNASPPYQAVVYFPSGEALELPSSGYLGNDWWLDFIMRSGRALVHPIYQGTYERRPTGPPGKSQWREQMIQWSKDLGRSIDYLETRPDVDRARLAYYGMSLGAESAPVLLALEPRIKAAVLLWGGLPDVRFAEVVEPVNYAPRARMPLLMVNGRHDFIFPIETSQRPLFRLFGAPEGDKRHVLFEYGHIPSRNQDVIREVLDWLDSYLGPVERKPAG
jgi:hypothetical protein